MTTIESTAPSIHRILRWYRIAFVACIVALGASTVWRSAGAPFRPEHAHAAILGMVEVIMALLMLTRRTQVAGVAGLLVVLAIATVITIASRQLPFHLVLYAASAIAILQVDRALTRGDVDGHGGSARAESDSARDGALSGRATARL